MSTPADTEPAVVDRIGPYRVEEHLGRGGMGEVYRGFDERLDRPVALKRVKPEANERAAARKRFRREAKIVAKLSHGSVVQVYDWVEGEDSDWIVMELVDGRSLREALQDGPLELGEAVRIAREIASGLGAAHEVGLIHRDLKPDNVMLTAGGAVKILDFGLAKQVHDDTTADMSISEVSVEGQIRGTVTHMSPEQAMGRKLDHRSDFFALGTILYECVTGVLPFRGQNSVETLTQICTTKQKPVGDFRLGVPKELSQLIDSLLAKSPARRPSNAGLVIVGLDKARDAIAGSLSARSSMSIADVMTLVSGEAGPVPATPSSSIQLKTLLLSDLVDSTKLVYDLGDEKSAQVFRRHDQVARELLAAHDGLEIDKSDGFLMLFNRPIDAVAFALAYHEALATLSVELGVQLRTRIGIHMGEVVLSENSPEEIARGAKPLEVEGLAKPTAARIMTLARGRQTLMSDAAFHLAREAAADTQLAERELRWLAHGPYLFKGVPDPVDVFEVGIPGVSLLEVPPDSEKVRRAVAAGDEMTLGWRPGPGQQIPRRGGWTLERELGRGGFGEAWLARHEDTGDTRVFKFCHDPEQLRSLQREVTLFRLLKDSLGDHPRIVHILDWSFDEAPYFLEAEYVSGGDLLHWSETQGGLDQVSLDDRLEIVAQIADALAAAHSVGILHKDVKPGNVLLAEDRDGRPLVKLADFGVAQLLDKKELLARGITVQGMTEEMSASSSIAGSHIYMAPEVSEGKPATVQADLYALGVLLYQVVVGELGRALAPGWNRDVEDEILAEDIAAFVDGEPSRRPGSAREVADRLRGLEERRAERDAERQRLEEAEATRKALVDAQRRRKVATWVASAAVVVLAVVSVLAVIAVRARREAERSQEVAVQRRGQAEDLIGFMLGDLQGKLEPLGRLDILNAVGDQAMEYFASVPSAELSAEEIFHRSEALNQIGAMRLNEGNLDAALMAYQEALDLARGLAQRAPQNIEWQKRLAAAHFFVGKISWQREDLELTLKKFEAQLDISQRLADQHPDDLDIQLELANSRNNVGFVQRARGDLQGAMEAFRFALRVMEDLVEKEPDDMDLKFEYGNRATALGSLLWQTGEVKAAREHFEVAQSVFQAMVEKDPSNTFWQERLMISHQLLGRTLQAAGDLEGANQHLEVNLEIAEQLVAFEPQQTDWQRELALAHRQISHSLMTQGRTEEALEHAHQGLTILATLAANEPTPSLQRELGTAHIYLGRVLVEHGDRPAARQQASQALALLEPRAGQNPEDRETHRRLGEGLLLLGHVQDSPTDAREAWESAAAALEPFARDSADLDLLVPWGQVLALLGRQEEAANVEHRLEELRRQVTKARPAPAGSRSTPSQESRPAERGEP